MPAGALAAVRELAADHAQQVTILAPDLAKHVLRDAEARIRDALLEAGQSPAVADLVGGVFSKTALREWRRITAAGGGMTGCS